MRVRQRGLSRTDVKWRSIQYYELTIRNNMHYILKKERPYKIRDVLKRIGAIRW